MQAQKWASEHPTATVFIVLGVAGLIILAAYPGLIYKPMLDALGFTSEGVAAGKQTPVFGLEALDLLFDRRHSIQFTGYANTDSMSSDSIAAAVHSIIGNVSPGSVFAFLQSAGAEGYGAAALNAALRATGATIMTAGAADLIRQWMEGKFNGEVHVVEIGGL